MENDVEEEDRMVKLMSAAMPDGVKLVVHWVRNAKRAFIKLLDSPYEFSLIVAHPGDELNRLIGGMTAFRIQTPLFECCEHMERMQRNVQIHAKACLKAA